MIALKYSLVIEATGDPNFFGFYSPELEGFTGVGHSVEDCLGHPNAAARVGGPAEKARWGMEEHVQVLREQGLPVPPENANPRVIIENERRPAKTA